MDLLDLLLHISFEDRAIGSENRKRRQLEVPRCGRRLSGLQETQGGSNSRFCDIVVNPSDGESGILHKGGKSYFRIKPVVWDHYGVPKIC